jgi:metallophosphoesterase superfamily enzyme
VLLPSGWPHVHSCSICKSLKPEPQVASFRYVLDGANNVGADSDNIVFLAHLGDLTEDGLASEFAQVNKAFDFLDTQGVAYSVLAGNHDVDSSTDDQRGPTPYLDTMGPQRFKHSPTFIGASPGGYNTAHIFPAVGTRTSTATRRATPHCLRTASRSGMN